MKTNNYSLYKMLFGLCLLGLQTQSVAQIKDSIIDNSVVDVVKTFKPILSDAIKIPIQPNPDKPETKKPVYIYDLDVQTVQIAPNIYTIKPLSLGTSLLPKLKNNYSKIGFGNYNSPLVEFYLNTVRNKQMRAGIFYKHISANGNENETNFSNNTLHGNFNYFKSNQRYTVDAYYHRNRVQLYGRPDSFEFNADQGKIVYNLIDVKAGASNTPKDSASFSHQTQVHYYSYSNQAKQQENNLGIYTTLTKSFEQLPVALQAGFRMNQYDSAGTAYNRRFFYLNPEIKLEENNYYLKAGFNTFFETDSTDSKGYFFPKAEAGFQIIPKMFEVFGGLTGNVQVNTFRSITTENPFIQNPIQSNTVHKLELYGGFKGQLSPQCGFHIQSSSSQLENNLYFIYRAQDSLKLTDPSAGSQIAVYDGTKGTLTQLQIHVYYQKGEKWRINMSTFINNYKMDKLTDAFGRAEFESKLNIWYNIADKIYTKFDLFYIGERAFGSNTISNLTPVKRGLMNAYTDVNLGFEYRYKKHISTFLQLNNLTNNNYQRWAAYTNYRFNLMAGFTFTF